MTLGIEAKRQEIREATAKWLMVQRGLVDRVPWHRGYQGIPQCKGVGHSTADVLMASSMARGRTLNPQAVAFARKQREERITTLRTHVLENTATTKERRELAWKWGIRPWEAA